MTSADKMAGAPEATEENREKAEELMRFVYACRVMGYRTPSDTETIYAVASFLDIPFDQANSWVTDELMKLCEMRRIINEVEN